MRQLVDEGRRDPAHRVGKLEDPRRDRDILPERDPEEALVRVGIKADKDARSLQTEAKSLRPGSLQKAPLQLLRTPLSQMIFWLITMKALIICVI